MRSIFLCLLVALLLFPGQAAAKKKPNEVCGEPPGQAVARETSKQIDASLEARVKAIAGGSTTTAYFDATVYDTVLLSQDEVARQTLLYRLCLQHVGGAIPQNAYQEERRFILGMGTSNALPARPEKAEPAPTTLLGTWDVLHHHIRDTCSAELNLDSHQKWTINEDPQGGYSISAAGSNFPRMVGRMSGSTLSVSGLAGDGAWTSAQMVHDEGLTDYYIFSRSYAEVTLRPEGGFAGIRVTAYPWGPKGSTTVYYESCMSEFEITGTRMTLR